MQMLIQSYCISVIYLKQRETKALRRDEGGRGQSRRAVQKANKPKQQKQDSQNPMNRQKRSKLRYDRQNTRSQDTKHTVRNQTIKKTLGTN